MAQAILVVKLIPIKANIHCGKVEAKKEDVRSMQVTGGKVKIPCAFSLEVKMLTTTMTATTLADMKKKHI